MNRYIFIVLTTIGLSIGSASAENFKLESPDSHLKVMVSNDDGALKFSVMKADQVIVAPSSLGMLLEGEEELILKVKGQKSRSFDETWKPICGKRSEVRNQFNELSLTVAVEGKSPRRMGVVFRAYDEGVAFRYIIGLEDKTPQKVVVSKDLSTLTLLEKKSQVWSYASEKRPIGPENITEIIELRNYPVMIKDPRNFWITITEASLHAFDNFDVTFTKNSIAQFHIDSSDVTTPFNTPWRVIMISKTPETFIDSDLLVNLSPPPEGDFSWVKTGLSFWDWRAWGHEAKDGFTYGLNIESWKRFIDFAVEHEIPYLLLDANWYGPEHSTLSDPFSGGKAAQVKEALNYGKEKGVGLILYLNDKASINFSIEEITKAYSEWGAAGIKYGFMRGKSQQKVLKTERVVRACAKNKLIVNFHDGPIPPTGHERTWPNWSTREFVHAQSDAKRTHLPSDFVHMAYLNTITGPIDGNHGMFDQENAVAQRPRMFKKVCSTIVSEAARTLILYSGLTVIPDSPDSYKEHLDLFQFIAAQKQPWKQSRTLAGEFGKWITTMRQAKDSTYLVGTATDESSRTVKISMGFLEPKKQYNVTILKDTKEAHYQTNRSAYSSEQRVVTSADSIEAYLAPGGGHCIIIKEKP